MSAPELSFVIPAYNEAARLPPSLEKILAWGRAWGRPFEVVVVDDGSRDGTSERARQVGGEAVTVLRNEPNRGKGYSVRRGMLAARGTRRLMTDADLSTPIEDTGRLLAALDEGCEVAIGSRAVAGASVEVHQPWYREGSGRLFNLCVRALVLPGVRDTQCGFKLFTEQAAEAAFSRSTLDGFGFDVEALFVARLHGFRLREVGVTWRNDAATRVTTLSGAAAFRDLLRIRRNQRAGRYA